MGDDLGGECGGAVDGVTVRPSTCAVTPAVEHRPVEAWAHLYGLVVENPTWREATSVLFTSKPGIIAAMADLQHLSDIQTLRDNARKHIDRGPLTENYR